MKKLVIILALLIIQQTVKAQLDVGIMLSPQTTWLINNNVSDQGENLNYHTSFGFAGGVHGAFYFNGKVGVGAEINLNMFNQKYAGDASGLSYDFADHLNYVSIPILFELKTPGGFYFELGPQFNFLTSAKEDGSFDPDVLGLSYEDKEIKTGINSSMIGGLFGFGGRFQLAGNIYMTAGLRFFGSLNDATEEMSQTEFEEALLTDKLGIAATFAHTDQQGDFSYEKTLAISGGIVIGVVYSLGAHEAEKK